MLPFSLKHFPLTSLLDSPSQVAHKDSSEFHLHPHYRTPTPLDATLLKVRPGLDDFISEKCASQVSAILNEWSFGLLQSPQNTKTFEKVLASEFRGTSLQPSDSRVMRESLGLEVRRNTFREDTSLGRDAFLRELQTSTGIFSKILSAEFEVTSIELGSSSQHAQDPELRTRIRYEIVGTGNGFHREQRIGYWDLTWQQTASAELRL